MLHPCSQKKPSPHFTVFRPQMECLGHSMSVQSVGEFLFLRQQYKLRERICCTAWKSWRCCLDWNNFPGIWWNCLDSFPHFAHSSSPQDPQDVPVLATSTMWILGVWKGSWVSPGRRGNSLKSFYASHCSSLKTKQFLVQRVGKTFFSFLLFWWCNFFSGLETIF